MYMYMYMYMYIYAYVKPQVHLLLGPLKGGGTGPQESVVMKKKALRKKPTGNEHSMLFSAYVQMKHSKRLCRSLQTLPYPSNLTLCRMQIGPALSVTIGGAKSNEHVES